MYKIYTPRRYWNFRGTRINVSSGATVPSHWGQSIAGNHVPGIWCHCRARGTHDVGTMPIGVLSDDPVRRQWAMGICVRMFTCIKPALRPFAVYALFPSHFWSRSEKDSDLYPPCSRRLLHPSFDVHNARYNLYSPARCGASDGIGRRRA